MALYIHCNAFIQKLVVIFTGYFVEIRRLINRCGKVLLSARMKRWSILLYTVRAHKYRPLE